MVCNPALLRYAFAASLVPLPIMTINEWADKNRRLPASYCPAPGQWETSKFPFTKEIMEELSPSSPCQEVVLMGGAQIAKTELAINTIGYVADHEPGPVLYVGPTGDLVEKFSKHKLAPSIEESECLRAKIVDNKGKFNDAGSNTINVKIFPGGILMLAGANSAPSLRLASIRWLILDEVDSYPRDLAGEGDPVALARRRTASFGTRAKIFLISTPLIKETSRIERAFLAGDQRYYFVPCPLCAHMQRIEWEQIKWDENEHAEPINIRMECRSCKGAIEEIHKTEMLENGQWRPTFPGRKVASFHISSLYSPLGFYSWQKAVEEWLKANRENDNTLLQNIVNTVFGETWSLIGQSFNAATLVQTRREVYSAQVPDDVLILTAGVDVQGDRLEVEVLGWGLGEETWSIDYKVLHGDPNQRAVWDELDFYLRTGFDHETAGKINIACTLVDSGDGGMADVVYKYCQQREFMRVYASKGRAGFGLGIFKRSANKGKVGVKLFTLYVDNLKSRFYSQLRIQKSEDGIRTPGLCHFPESQIYNEIYFKGLVSEELTAPIINGRPGLRWVLKSGHRNEPLDCRVMCMGAFAILNPNLTAFEKPYSPNYTPAAMAPRRRGIRVISKGIQQ